MRCACGRENSLAIWRCPQCGKRLAAGADPWRLSIDAAALAGLLAALGIVFLLDRRRGEAPPPRRGLPPPRRRAWNCRRQPARPTARCNWPSRPPNTTTWARCSTPSGAAIATRRFPWRTFSTPSGCGNTTLCFSPAAACRWIGWESEPAGANANRKACFASGRRSSGGSTTASAITSAAGERSTLPTGGSR